MITTLALCALTAVTLQAPDTHDPAEAGRVRELTRDWVRDDGPGGVVGVLRDGETVVVECFGLADVAARRANGPETPFYVASLAKPFTAACAMHAAAAGAFALDARVTELFPDLPATYAATTMRQLLQHRSGIPDVYDAALAADLGLAPARSNADALALLAQLPRLAFEPGDRMLYCNSGYVLLAEAIARKTGRALPAYAREVLFEPLAMSHARYLGEPELRDAAKCYELVDGEWKEDSVLTGLRGPGGLFMALDDLLRFERAWLAGTWGTPELRAALLEAPPGWHHPRIGRYAAGWMLQELDGLRVQRHFGGAFGYSADLRRFPDQKVSVIVLSNAPDLDASSLCEAVARAVLAPEIAAAGHAAPVGVPLTEEARARFGRIWREPLSGQVWIVTPKPDHFVLATLGDLKVELVAASEKRLVGRNAQVPFAVELDGAALQVIGSDGVPTRLEAVPFPPQDLPPLDAYAGDYVSSSPAATIRLEVRGPQLALVQHEALLAIPPFIALAPDLFVCDKGAQIDFRRDADGRVSGLTISANRAWGLSFERRRD